MNERLKYSLDCRCECDSREEDCCCCCEESDYCQTSALSKILAALLGLVMLAGIAVGILNLLAMNQVTAADCVLVMASMDEEESLIYERVQAAIDLYNENKASAIVLSGDYETVSMMLAYCLEQGVSAEDIFCNYTDAGLYESMMWAQETYDFNNMIILTPDFYIDSATYITDIEA